MILFMVTIYWTRYLGVSSTQVCNPTNCLNNGPGICCNSYNDCGNDYSYCGPGCQSNYGTCASTTNPTCPLVFSNCYNTSSMCSNDLNYPDYSLCFNCMQGYLLNSSGGCSSICSFDSKCQTSNTAEMCVVKSAGSTASYPCQTCDSTRYMNSSMGCSICNSIPNCMMTVQSSNPSVCVCGACYQGYYIGYAGDCVPQCPLIFDNCSSPSSNYSCSLDPMFGKYVQCLNCSSGYSLNYSSGCSPIIILSNSDNTLIIVVPSVILGSMIISVIIFIICFIRKKKRSRINNRIAIQLDRLDRVDTLNHALENKDEESPNNVVIMAPQIIQFSPEHKADNAKEISINK